MVIELSSEPCAWIVYKLKNQEQEAWGKFWSCNLVCEEVATLKFIPYCLFSIPILNII